MQKPFTKNKKKEFLLPKTHTRETVTSIQKIIFEPTKKIFSRLLSLLYILLFCNKFNNHNIRHNMKMYQLNVIQFFFCYM